MNHDFAVKKPQKKQSQGYHNSKIKRQKQRKKYKSAPKYKHNEENLKNHLQFQSNNYQEKYHYSKNKKQKVKLRLSMNFAVTLRSCPGRRNLIR